jgi:FtsH-binding integral membrane protein
MAEFNGQFTSTPALDMSVDVGLRKFMIGVYNKMALGLLLTAALSWTVYSVEPVRSLFFATAADGRIGFTILGLVAQWAPLVMLLGMGFLRKMSPATASFMYWAVVSAFGVTGAVWFIMYDLGSIAQVFLITAASFGALSLAGYTTKMDLRPMGTFLIMALFGLIIASVVNIFMRNSMFDLIISLIGVAIFAGLTAYDTQKLKHTYYELGGNQSAMSVATSFGALSLYLDFINLFSLLLRLMGSRR